MSRKVTVFSFQTGKKEIDTDAETWGELKQDLADCHITTNGQKAIIKDSQITLDLDGAVLPEGDFVIFLSPEKVKSGYNK